MKKQTKKIGVMTKYGIAQGIMPKIQTRVIKAMLVGIQLLIGKSPATEVKKSICREYSISVTTANRYRRLTEAIIKRANLPREKYDMFLAYLAIEYATRDKSVQKIAQELFQHLHQEQQNEKQR